MTGDFHMKFVKPKDGETDPALLEAFNMLREHDLTPEWVDEDHCLSVDVSDKNCAYVVDPFQGAAFDHLKLLACRVYGAQCILASLNMKVELPQKKRPIYNVAMKGVMISCTNMDRKNRERMHQLVELMAGEASRDLVEEVTHVVAGEVGRQKYLVSAGRGTPIMMVDWVDQVWAKAQHRYLHATDTEFAKLRCPVFKSLVVTVSGLDPQERKKVQHYVDSEGGTYTGEMKMNHCTHLIVKEPKGQKYEYARKWKVHVVSLNWLYESLDKNFCQDESKYHVERNAATSGGVKTSTPERSRLSVVRPGMPDVSMISTGSNTHIDETALTRTHLWGNDTTGSENFEHLDVSVAPGNPFIESCRLYLSAGIKGSLLDKCRKIINMGGATRFDEINENVTHVIMEDKVDSEINAVHSLDLRPHVVNAAWLAESYKQGCQVGEEPYLSPHLLVSELELPKLHVSNRKSLGEKRKSEGAVKSDAAAAPASSTVAKETRDGGEDGEMVELLSQYMDDSTMDGEKTIQPADEVDGNSTVSVSRQGRSDASGHGNGDSTLDCEVSAEGDGVFRGRTFVFLGFSDDDLETLTSLVGQFGGKGLSPKEAKGRVPDFAVVPLAGCPVEMTVGEVVTNGWLHMCIEAETMLPVDGLRIFQPLDIDETARPLEGCVLSISGYSGVEKDCLIHVTDILGAVHQDYFVRRAKQAHLANTHLIVREPSGNKYTAAKHWRLPAVSKEWLLACAQSGKREDEDRFNIDNIPDDSLLHQHPSYPPPLPQKITAQPPQATSSRECSDSGTKDQATRLSASHTPRQSAQQQAEGLSSEEPDLNPSPRQQLQHSSNSKDRHESAAQLENPLIPQSSLSSADSVKSGAAASSGVVTDRVPSSGASVDREPVGERGWSDVHNPMSSAKAMLLEQQEQDPRQQQDQQDQQQDQQQQPQQRPRPQSQKENLTRAGYGTWKTPLRKKPQTRKRVEELQQQSKKPILSPGGESPSVYLAPGFRPNFDLREVYAYLKTPEGPANKVDSPTLQEVFDHHIQLGVKNSSVPQASQLMPSSSQCSQQQEEQGPLVGVVISVSKKLSANQAEYNTMVVEMGGDYHWKYSPSCTHFIFQGRVNDLNKEFRQAKSQGKIIVSPHWLYACVEQEGRVDESMYPHSYNPNLNLASVVKTETPSRSLRRSARKITTPGPETSSSAGSGAQTSNPKTAAVARALTAELQAELKTPAKAVAESWQQSMNEMRQWQSGATTTTTTTPSSSSTHAKGGRDTAKKRLGAVVEVTSAKRTPPKNDDAQTSVKTEAEKSSSSPASNAQKSLSKNDGDGGQKSLCAGGNEGQVTTSSPPPVHSNAKASSSSSASSSTENKSGGGPKCGDVAEKSKKVEAESTAVTKEVTESEGGGSLEIRQALSKTLATVKASSSRSKKTSKRRNKRSDLNSSGDQTNLSGNLPDAVTHHASPWETRHNAQDGAHGGESLGTEASQSVQITWDDPTGRREKERLAHKLDMVCGPSQNTQNTEDFMADMAMPELNTSPQTPKVGPMSRQKEPVRTPTPEPPPLAFPVAKLVSRVRSPQPIELLSEESSASTDESAKPVILTSGMAAQERIDFGEVTERLGGTMLDKQQFDPACTHVVVIKPQRNEKFLAAVATGRWVLHKSYLMACRQEGHFVKEEDHEWGNPAMSHFMQTLDSATLTLVQAAHKWRQKVHAIRKTNPGCKGAFQGWQVILLTEPKRAENFKRLLSAGGATVLSVKPPLTEVSATHAFVELQKLKLSESDLRALIEGVDHVLKPEYIPVHLTEQAPNMENFTPPEVTALLVSCQPRKRKAQQQTADSRLSSSSKRSRR